MSRVFRLLPVLVVLAAACGNDRGSSGAAASSTPAPEPTPEKAPEPPPLPSCEEGASVDPPSEQLELPEGQNPNSVPAKLNHLRHLMKRYPRSPSLRVKAAALSLGPAPAGNPVETERLLTEALKLHANGCRLPEDLEWEANENLGLAHLLQKNYGEAAKVFQGTAKRWPNIPHAHFDLACAKCRLNEIDACHAAFSESLRVAEDEDPPEFINDELNAYHFVHQSRQSADLAALRSDPRYEETIAPHLRKAR